MTDRFDIKVISHSEQITEIAPTAHLIDPPNPIAADHKPRTSTLERGAVAGSDKPPIARWRAALVSPSLPHNTRRMRWRKEDAGDGFCGL